MLHDVVITGIKYISDFFYPSPPLFFSVATHSVSFLYLGDNGTIDGQGSVWWDWFSSHSLNYTRPPLVEFIDSKDVVVSNLTFLNAPAYNIHPVYCRLVSWTLDGFMLFLLSNLVGVCM